MVCDVKATCDPTLKKDSANFETYAKNIYRVLMTRGMKGCYVYFCDKEVEAYFRKHIQGGGIDLKFSDIISIEEETSIQIEEDVKEILKYKEYLPVYTLEAACGGFGEGQDVDKLGWLKVDIDRKLDKNMFIIKAVGHSMEPMIKDSDYCVFRANVVGSRNNKIVLVQHNSIEDPETGGRYTIKKYSSKKKIKDDDDFEHEEIVLSPNNPKYSPIIINNPNEGNFMVVGEFIGVLK